LGDKIETEMGKACSKHGVDQRCIQDFGGETSGTENTPRRRWEDNITMDLQEVGCGAMDWIDVAQNREKRRVLVNGVVKLQMNAGIVYLEIYHNILL
jgi:hypothetical protein